MRALVSVYNSGLAARLLGAGVHYLSSADDEELELMPGAQQESEIAGK